MNKKHLRGIPIPFQAAVVFAVFFTLLGSPLSNGDNASGGILSSLTKLRAYFYEKFSEVEELYFRTSPPAKDSSYTYPGDIKGGRKIRILDADGTTDPPPPPPPPKP